MTAFHEYETRIQEMTNWNPYRRITSSPLCQPFSYTNEKIKKQKTSKIKHVTSPCPHANLCSFSFFLSFFLFLMSRIWISLWGRQTQKGPPSTLLIQGFSRANLRHGAESKELAILQFALICQFLPGAFRVNQRATRMLTPVF